MHCMIAASREMSDEPKKIPERSEDDFFPANKPDRAALRSQWQRAIFAVRNEIVVYALITLFITFL